MADKMQSPDKMASPTKKKKWYKQSFKEEWLDDPALKDWLLQDRNMNGGYCTCCAVVLKNANKSMLMKHKNSEKHKRRFLEAHSCNNVTQYMTNCSNYKVDADAEEQENSNDEIGLSDNGNCPDNRTREIKIRRLGLQVPNHYTENYPDTNVSHHQVLDTSMGLPENEDECLVLGKWVALQLKEMDHRQRLIAEKLVSDVVYNGRLGNLTEHSSVNLSPPFSVHILRDGQSPSKMGPVC